MHQRLHHISALGREKQIYHWMQGTVGIPHAVIFIIHFSFRKLPYRGSIRKRGITPIHIIECMRQERGTIESTVKHFLVCKLSGFYINGREVLLPDLSQICASLTEVPMRNFSLQVLQSTVPVGKGGSGFYQHFFAFSYIKFYISTYLCRITYPGDTLRQGISPEHTVSRQLLLQLNDEMSAIPCRFSPALINAVNRIVSVDLIVEGIDADVSLTFITVGIHHQITFSCFSVGETEDSGTRTARHFSKDILIR